MTVTIDVQLDGDNAWSDLRPRSADVIQASPVGTSSPVVWHLAALEGGMASGAVSLALRIDIPDGQYAGRVVLAETSLAAWIAATCVLRGRFPEAFAGTPLEARGEPYLIDFDVPREPMAQGGDDDDAAR